MRTLRLAAVAAAALAAAAPARADDAKPYAGQSITILVPSPTTA
jgi:multiple sugar transport system substrate-binding protein